jgi:L-rhamnose mutarotase
VKRYGSVIEIREDKIREYRRLHSDVWPGVLSMIRESGIKNYSIYLRRLSEDRWFLFSYFEYVGDNFEAGMKKMSEDEETRRWWDVCKPCHIPLADREEGEWWAAMEEVFHQE